MAEEEPLLVNPNIQKAVTSPDEDEGRTISWRELLLVPIFFIGTVGSSTFSYICDEWTQQYVRDEYFSNISVTTNFSLCDINKSDSEYVTYKNVQQKSAQWLMYFKLAQITPNILASLILPSCSDFYGRRKFIIFSLVGSAVKVCGITFVMFDGLPLFYIAIAYAIYGASEVLMTVSFSYVADITRGEKQRVRGIIFLDFLMVTISLVSSPMSGLLVQTFGLGFVYTGVICSVLVVISLVLACLFLPETLHKNHRQPAKSIVSTLRKVFSFYSTEAFKVNQRSFVVLLIIFMVISCGGNRTQMEILYLLGQPFCWGPALIGYFTLARHAAQVTLGMLVVIGMQKCMSNVAIAALSCISGAGSFVVEGLARTDAMIYLAPVVGMLSILMYPMVRGLMSNMTPPETQGSMFASLAVVQMLGDLVSSFQNEIYSASLSIMDGFVFLCMAGINVITFMLLLLFCCIQPQKELSTRK